MISRGRPAFAPTDKHRGQVEAMVVCGIPETEIAAALGISAPTLRKHFRTEIDVSFTEIKVKMNNFILASIFAEGDPTKRLNDERARDAGGVLRQDADRLEGDTDPATPGCRFRRGRRTRGC